MFRFFFDLLGSDLQIYAVTPVPDGVGVLQMDRVPDRIKSFYRVNNVGRFRYDRPFHKGPKDRDNEFKVSFVPPPFLHQDEGTRTRTCCFYVSESVDREDHPGPQPPPARDLALVRGGEERAGEKTT